MTEEHDDGVGAFVTTLRLCAMEQVGEVEVLGRLAEPSPWPWNIQVATYVGMIMGTDEVHLN